MNRIEYIFHYGKTIKKLPRYQQLRAVNKIVDRLKNENRGGVVWHTQGSGKSITMVYLATKLRAPTSEFDNPTILVLTDRTDLDNQISSTFRRTGFSNPIQASSITHLKTLLKDSYGKTLTSTIQKFQDRAENWTKVQAPNKKIQGAGTLVPKSEILSEKENIFVLIDEAHRSQYGLTASYMRQSLPNAKFIAFTGTPIDKENKSTLNEFYGGDYIDKYTIKQSVADGNTLPIFYETGLSKFFIEKELLDAEFKKSFGNESAKKQTILKTKATGLDKNATRRVQEIAKSIVEHYKNKSYLDGFKAMIVCHNRYQAIIKANEEENPELALELSELLEKKLIDAKIDRKQAVIDLFSDMEEIINRHKNRHSDSGLSDERQLVVYDLVKELTEEADKLTLEIFDELDEWLSARAILIQSDAQKDMRKVIKPIFTKYGVDKKMSKDIVARLVATFV